MSASSLTLDEQHDVRNAEAWYPYKAAGKDQPYAIAGELVLLDSVWSDYAEAFKVIAVIRETEGKCWQVRTYPARLHDEWCKAAPQIGERVGVKFTGVKEHKRYEKAYPDFSVVAEREGPPPAFDYARMGGPSPDAGSADEPEPTDAPASTEQPAAAPAGVQEGKDDIPF
jgi:hypothetical protein